MVLFTDNFGGYSAHTQERCLLDYAPRKIPRFRDHSVAMTRTIREHSAIHPREIDVSDAFYIHFNWCIFRGMFVV
jgi:hypothetical protein